MQGWNMVVSKADGLYTVRLGRSQGRNRQLSCILLYNIPIARWLDAIHTAIYTLKLTRYNLIISQRPFAGSSDSHDPLARSLVPFN